MILALERYWADYGCVLMQPYHTELAAGTMSPNTFLRSLGPAPWKVAYVEPVIRPLDGRYGENPFRFQYYFQYQVVLKPAPENVLDEHRGRGLGEELVRATVDEGPLADCRWLLDTRDAHGLYAKFGFQPPNERLMERPRHDLQHS